METIEIKAHSLEIDDIVKHFLSSLEMGISEEEANNRINKYGLNELVQTRKVSPLQILAHQFKDFLIYLLMFAIAISLVIGIYELSKNEEPTSFIDALVIFLILILNSILGFYQEYKAEKSLESLKKMAPHNAKVKRGGIVKEINAKYLVPGDIIKLDEGDKIPVDARLIKAYSLYIDEAILTGESKPVKKNLDLVNEKTILADHKNMAFTSTIVTRGNGEAIVVGTGMNTKIGKIAENIQIEEEPSPFKLEITRFGKQLAKIIIILCALLFIFEVIIVIATNPLVFGDIHVQGITKALTFSISIAVAAVPEGLVVVITIIMSIGVRKMANRNALVKTLNAVETLGRVNIICTDKTGTLTKNEMTVVKVFLGGKEFDVEGVGYNIEGKIIDESGKPISRGPELRKFLEVCMFCNNSNVHLKNDGTRSTYVVGDPTEISLKVLALKMDLDTNTEKIYEIPFNSDRKMMSVVVKIENNLFALIKGAPDVLLKNATRALYNGEEEEFNGLDKSDVIRDLINSKNKELAQNALRVLGIAYKPLKENYNEEDIETDFTYLGLVGIIDPARDEVKDSIKEARMAGIRTIMITGDHKITALAIAKQIGLTDNEEAITGAKLEELDNEEVKIRLKTVNVFARVTSEHKLRILNVLKEEGNIVSMTGDGVNNAPALKGAHVGVAMGLKGTEVSQEAADAILLDDNYATIINAIEEGRGIFNTTKGFFRFMLCANFAEIIIILVAWLLMSLFSDVFIGLPLEPIQILWINVVTDGIPAIVMGLTPTDPDLMKFKPRKGFNIINDIKKPTAFVAVIAGVGGIVLYILAWTVLIPFWSTFDPALIYGGTIFSGTDFARYLSAKEYQIAFVQTMLFAYIVFFELFLVFSCTSEHKSMFEFPNKHLFWAVGLSIFLFLLIIFTPFGFLFHTIPIFNPIYWLIIILSSLMVIPFEEIRKYFRRKKLAMVSN